MAARSRRLTEALNLLNRAIQLQPAEATLYVRRAGICFRLCDLSGAVLNYRRALALGGVPLASSTPQNAATRSISELVPSSTPHLTVPTGLVAPLGQRPAPASAKALLTLYTRTNTTYLYTRTRRLYSYLFLYL